MGEDLRKVHHFIMPAPQPTSEERLAMTEGRLNPLTFHKPPPNMKVRILFGERVWVYTQENPTRSNESRPYWSFHKGLPAG